MFPKIAYAAAPHLPALEKLVYRVNDIILNPIIRALFWAALLYFFWGLYQFLWNRNDIASGKTEGRQHMIYGIIGMVIMLSVYGIMQFLTATFGVNVVNVSNGKFDTLGAEKIVSNLAINPSDVANTGVTPMPNDIDLYGLSAYENSPEGKLSLQNLSKLPNGAIRVYYEGVDAPYWDQKTSLMWLRYDKSLLNPPKVGSQVIVRKRDGTEFTLYVMSVRPSLSMIQLSGVNFEGLMGGKNTYRQTGTITVGEMGDAFRDVVLMYIPFGGGTAPQTITPIQPTTVYPDDVLGSFILTTDPVSSMFEAGKNVYFESSSAKLIGLYYTGIEPDTGDPDESKDHMLRFNFKDQSRTPIEVKADYVDTANKLFNVSARKLMLAVTPPGKTPDYSRASIDAFMASLRSIIYVD